MIFLGTGNRGEEVKKKLGLQNFKNVYYFYFIGIQPRITFVIFDSWSPNRVWNTKRIRSQLMLKVKKGTFLGMKDAKMTPLFRMESFNANPARGLYVAIDLCGSRFVDKNMYMKESVEKEEFKISPVQGRLNEFVTLAQLNNPNLISTVTMGFRKERTKLMGAENIQAKLIDVVISKGDNSVTFQFLTESTPKYGKDFSYKETDPNSKELKSNPSKTYEIDIKILEFFSWLDTYPDKTIITPKDMRDILDVSNVQVWSNSPSHQFQGFAYWLTQIGAEIYPEDRKPQRWDKIHGTSAKEDKHLYGLLRQIKFFRSNMASMLSKKLKDRGYL